MNSEILSLKEWELKVYVGIDVHLKSYSVTAVIDGAIDKRWRMPSDGEKLASILKDKYRDRKIYSVYEAGFSGLGLHRSLCEAGIENIVINPASIAVRAGDRVKTDKKDSANMARQLSAGLLSGIRIPTLEEELRRQLPRTRQQLIKDRTRVMVQIRRRLCHFGYNQEESRVLRRQWVSEVINSLDEKSPLRWCIESQLRVWTSIVLEIKSIERLLAEQASECPLEAVYRSIPGIGRVSSRVLACELGDMSQFSNEKALFCYIGLTPTEHSSGDNVRRGHISRQGKPIIRKTLVEAAWTAVKRDPEIRRYYLRLSARTGGKRAIVAVARKLIGRARALFRKGEHYKTHSIVEKELAA